MRNIIWSYRAWWHYATFSSAGIERFRGMEINLIQIWEMYAAFHDLDLSTILIVSLEIAYQTDWSSKCLTNLNRERFKAKHWTDTIASLENSPQEICKIVWFSQKSSDKLKIFFEIFRKSFRSYDSFQITV